MTDRRGFFKELLRDAAGAIQEFQSLFAEPEETEEWQPPPPSPAQRATGVVGDDDLLALAQEQSLGDRLADVRRTARASLRLTHNGLPGQSRLGGSPLRPRGAAWPDWEGRELAFLGQIDLVEVAAVESDTNLPGEGLLQFFFDLDSCPSGLEPGHRGSCRVVLVPAAEGLETDEARSPALRTFPLELSREVMLPGAWSFQAEELALSPEESEAWDELRDRLALGQGVELEERSPDRLALHRLLGYQDEIGREVELDCELASIGLDASDAAAYHESRADHEEPARDWRLLLQLSEDESLGTPSGFDRLFVCLRERDLLAGNFDAAWAILR